MDRLLEPPAVKLNANCIISVLDGREVVYVARETYKEFTHHYVHVGARSLSHPRQVHFVRVVDQSAELMVNDPHENGAEGVPRVRLD